MKIGIVLHFYQLNNILKISKTGVKFPRHHLWGYDYLLNKGFIVEEEPHWKKGKSSLLNMLFSVNRNQQIQISRHNIDLLYSPFFFDCYYLALLRCLGLYKKPIIAIAQDTWRSQYTDNMKTKIKWNYYRFLAQHGVDRLLFISPNVLAPISSCFDCKKTFALQHWGVDLEYFDAYRKVHEPRYDYAYATGGSNRDFTILYSAALKDKENKILIQTKKMASIQNTTIPSNVTLDTSVTQESDLLDGYNNALCVLVPLKKDTGSMTGITVVMEAMAMGKAVISTKSDYYPFDIEKEGCGIYIEEGDAKGWQKAISYLRENLEIAKEMGCRGRKLVETKYNYNLFCSELEQHINELLS